MGAGEGVNENWGWGEVIRNGGWGGVNENGAGEGG